MTSEKILNENGKVVGFVRATDDGRARAFNARGRSLATLQDREAASAFVLERRAA